MTQLTIVSSNSAPACYSVISVAHDLRNLLATLGLQLETLQRLAGPGGAKAASTGHALIERSAMLCNAVLESASKPDGRPRRRGVDLVETIRHVAELLSPTAPPGFSFAITQHATVLVLADPDDIFRILFNVMNNAVAVAARKPGTLTTLTIGIAQSDTAVTVNLADDGPGLPASVRAALCTDRTRRAGTARHGYGLPIARELAERNGGTITLAEAPSGASFLLRVPAFPAVLRREDPPQLGRRAMAI